MTRIGMILEKRFPPDIRVEKEVGALIASGFDVGLLCRMSSEQALVEDLKPGFRVYRTSLRPMSGWERLTKRLALMDSAWLEAIHQYIHDFQPDVLHVHDFPLVKTVLNAAKDTGLPVVADLHENMPAALLVYREGRDRIQRIRDSIERSYYLWKWHEKKILPLCNHILVVVPEASERLDLYGIPKKKISVVSNTEEMNTFDLQNLDSEVLAQYQDKWIVSFLGGVGAHRGIDTVIRAVSHIADRIPNFQFLVVGVNKKDRYYSYLLRLAKQLNVEGNVEFIGWQPFEKMNSYVAISAVCLVPHNRSEHTETTVPHKLFQYMLAGKPVIVSDVGPLKRIVDETRSGLVFTADDPAALAQRILELYENPDLGKKLGENGQQAANGKYSWKHDAHRLVKIYSNITERTK